MGHANVGEVPYTPEELAMLRAKGYIPSTAGPAAGATTPPPVYFYPGWQYWNQSKLMSSGAGAGAAGSGGFEGAMRGVKQRQEQRKGTRAWIGAKREAWRQQVVDAIIASGRPIPPEFSQDPKWGHYFQPSTTAGGATTYNSSYTPQPNYPQWLQQMAVWRQ
jgi:hypothetical protein